jgi:hypothetical protein
MIPIKKTARQTVWLNDEQMEILKRLAAKCGGLNRAETMRFAMIELARTKGIFATGKPRTLRRRF